MSTVSHAPSPAPVSALMLVSRARLALAIKLLAAGTGYGFAVAMARLLGAQGFGIVGVSLAAATFLSVLGARGAQMAALRFVPPLAGSRDAKATLCRFSGWALRRATGGAAAVAIVALPAAAVLADAGWLDGFSPPAILAGLLLVPLVGWSDMVAHLTRASGHLALSLLPKEVFWRASVLLAAALMTTVAPLTPVAVLLVLGLALAAICLAQTALLYRATGIAAAPFPVRPVDRDWPQAARSFWVSSVSNIFLSYGDVALVGIIAGARSAGLYFAANRLAMLLAFLLTSYNVVLGPALADLWQRGEASRFAELVHRATLKATLPTAVLGLGLFVGAPAILGLFGDGFAQAAPVLRLLILARLVNAAAGPTDIALNMAGEHRAAMRASIVALILGAGCLVSGALAMGAPGVAAGVLCASLLRKGLFWDLAHRRLGTRCDIAAAVRAAAAPAASAAPVTPAAPAVPAPGMPAAPVAAAAPAPGAEP